MNSMQKDFGAFRAKLAALVITAGLPAYEKREAPDMKKLAEAIDGIGRGFEEYKKTNDQRLEAIKAGKGTADLDVKLAAIDTELNKLTEIKSEVDALIKKASRPGLASGEREQREDPAVAEYRDSFVNWIRKSADADAKREVEAKWSALQAKARAGELDKKSAQVITSTGSAGGFALPEQIERQIARLSVDISPIRSIATVRTVGSPDYKELFDVNGAGFEWLGEGDTRNQTNTPDLAEVAPTFGMASAKPQATEESLDDLFFDVENWLITSAAEAIAAGEGAAYVSGNGTKKPTGFLAGPTPVATADSGRAFGTLQYIASGQASAMPTSADVFYSLVYGIRARYRSNARWVTSKAILAALRSYKDTTNAYLWQPSLVAGQPDAFMGYPIVEAEDMPAVAANAFPLAFGDFREGYLIADRVGMRMTRDEITSPGFVKFYIRKRTGGKIRNSQAIKLLKIALS